MRAKRPFVLTAPARPHPLRLALAGSTAPAEEPAPDRLADVRLFLTVWLGGLVFFATYLA